MKIGIDIRAIGKKRTGDEVYFFNLVKNLAKIERNGSTATGNEYVLFIDRDPEKDSDLAGEIKKSNLGKNFQVVFIDSSNRFWWNLWALPNYLRKNPACPVGKEHSGSPTGNSDKFSDGVDIFHTQYIAPFWLPKNVKLVLTIHDISFNFFPQFIKKSDLFFLKTLIPRSIRRADKIITVSRNEREQLVKFYKISPEKVDFTYNGVDFERFGKDFSTDEKAQVRKKYNLPEKFLLYVGTMQPRKNIPALLRALAVFYEKYGTKDVKLVIVGNKKARNFDRRIDEEIKNNSLEEQIVFPGWVADEDLPVIYKLAECFVFPSLCEGFGIPIVEAMAAGLPVVSSNKSCLPEVGGDAALFADPGDPNAFAGKIHEVLSNENVRTKLIEKGASRTHEFSWPKTAQKTLAIYKSLARKIC